MRKNISKQNGITLIALIITIIVMLILVGITINIAFSGGLFEKASNASIQTQKQADKEALLFAIVGSLDNSGQIDEELLQTNATNAGFQMNGASFPYTFTSGNGNTFTVTEDGEIIEGIPEEPSFNTFYSSLVSPNNGVIIEIGEENITISQGNDSQTSAYTIENGNIYPEIYQSMNMYYSVENILDNNNRLVNKILAMNYSNYKMNAYIANENGLLKSSMQGTYVSNTDNTVFTFQNDGNVIMNYDGTDYNTKYYMNPNMTEIYVIDNHNSNIQMTQILLYDETTDTFTLVQDEWHLQN